LIDDGLIVKPIPIAVCAKLLTLWFSNVRSERKSIVKDDVEQRTVNFQSTVIADETKFAKLVQKKAHAGAGSSDHLS
jgi:hypothetical protein